MSIELFEDVPQAEPHDGAPPRPRRRRRAALIVVSGFLLAAAAGFGYVKSVASGDYAGTGTDAVTVRIAAGDSLRTIGDTLHDAGVVKSTDAFISAAEANPKARSIGPGSYDLRREMSGAAAVILLLDPAARSDTRIKVVEGARLDDIVTTTADVTGKPAEIVLESVGRAGALGLPAYARGNAEGYLFPATYDVPENVDGDAIISAMLARFDKTAASIDLVARAQQQKVDPARIVVVASLVQAEARPADFAKVARVIYNRLDVGMKLQLDSTVNFGLGTKDLRLSKDQLASDTPYNTYRIPGLPPTPIGSPGKAALEAALAPAAGPWLYFVTTDPKAGTTKFTDDYKQFLRWKAQFRASA